MDLGALRGEYEGAVSSCAVQPVETLVETLADALNTRYEASHDGWDPEEKRKELFDRESRFIVLRADPSSPPLGYTIFRFDTEETADTEEADVVYL